MNGELRRGRHAIFVMQQSQQRKGQIGNGCNGAAVYRIAANATQMIVFHFGNVHLRLLGVAQINAGANVLQLNGFIEQLFQLLPLSGGGQVAVLV